VFRLVLEFFVDEVVDAREGSWGRYPVGLTLLSC
jgi:hypothetical protein